MAKRFGFGFLVSWFRRKIVDPLHQILRRGAEPKQLAFSAALGITLGLFPICGVTVFLCGLAIAVLGSHCHAPTVMLTNFVATPIELRVLVIIVMLLCLCLYHHNRDVGFDVFYSSQIAKMHDLTCFGARLLYYWLGGLMVPFLRFGEFITGGPHFALTSDALKKVITGKASWEVLQSIFHALLGWLVAAPFIFGGLYLLCLPCFKMLIYRFAVVPSSPKKPLSSILSPRKSLNSPNEVRLKVRGV